MTNPPAFQLYAADFYMDTEEWTVEEIGIYTRLLFYEWVNNDLPTDYTRLARIAGCSLKRFQKGFCQVQSKFSQNGKGRLVNRKLEEIREKQWKYREEQARKGKKGAEKRWESDSHGHSNGYSHGHSNGDGTGNGRDMALQSSSSIKDKDPKKELFQLPNKEEINESSMPKIKEDIEEICDYLYETKKFPKVHAFKNKMLKEEKYERAILHTLVRCALKDNFEDTPWAYCKKIIEVENGNYIEYEYGKDKG